MRFLLVAAIFQLADGTRTAAAGALRGMRDAKVPAVFAVLAYWALGLPLAAYLAEVALRDAIGVWIAMAICVDRDGDHAPAAPGHAMPRSELLTLGPER